MTKNRKTEIFNVFKQDFKNAMNSKATIDTLIQSWNDLYYGKDKANSSKKLLMKEVAKLIEYQKPIITEPFLSTNNPIKISRAGNIASKCEVENYANSVFAGELDREEFINDLVDVYLREGTVWTRNGWVRERRVETVTRDLTWAEIIEMDKEPDNIIQVDEDLYECTFDTMVTIRNHPNSRVCRNENCFPDPTARQEKDMNFFIERRYLTYYDIKDMNILTPNKLSVLKNKILSGEHGSHSSESSLESHRDAENTEYGSDKNLVTDDLNRIKVKFIEYWGYFDLDDNGKSKPVLASWIDGLDMDLELTENPMPSKSIPYNSARYSSRPFSLWGNAPAFFFGENQNVKNGLIRGVLDSLALANNGQKFVMRGALDYINFQRLKKKERYVMVNKPDGIVDGKYNQIPTSTFNLLDMVSRESNMLAGIDGSPAVNGDALAKDGPVQLTMAQQKMVASVRSISGLISKNVKQWLMSSEVFLEDEQILSLFSNDGNPENDRTDINAFRESRKTTVVVNVGTSVSKQQELQQLNMLMQQTNALKESVPKELINSLVAKMYDLFEMHEQANELRNFVPQPSPVQQQLQELEVAKVQLEVAKLQEEIGKIRSETQKNMSGIETSRMDAEANYNYKGSQSQEKNAKTESHRVDSALRPSQMLMEFNKQRNEVVGRDR